MPPDSRADVEALLTARSTLLMELVVTDQTLLVIQTGVIRRALELAIRRPAIALEHAVEVCGENRCRLRKAG
jgi:hypothetical protein